MTLKEFVDQTMIKEQTALFKLGGDTPTYRYHLFILISIGIELLGATLDEKHWHKRGVSKKRFNRAIRTFESLKKYDSNGLYKKLRCGMAHVYLPNYGLGINMKSEGGVHNTVSGDKLLLTIEDFFKDYINACQELIKNIDKELNSLKLGKKCYAEILETPPDKSIKVKNIFELLKSFFKK